MPLVVSIASKSSDGSFSPLSLLPQQDLGKHSASRAVQVGSLFPPKSSSFYISVIGMKTLKVSECVFCPDFI